MRDPYLYPHSSILINKLDIKSERRLEDAEADYVSLRLREVAETPLPGNYDVLHFRKLHEFIFQDIYSWAGQFRTINIKKEEPALGGISIEYSDHKNIAKDIETALQEMRARSWQRLPSAELAKYFSKDLATLWKVHGFREGNTRVAVTFCCQFIDAQGIKIDRLLFEKYSAYLRTALVAYCATFPDLGDLSKKEYLEKIIADAFT